jgi:tRNA threonylcarbamoyladenosine biosynthesis protein TsaB
VALACGDALLEERRVPTSGPASETLLPTLLALLEAHGLTPGAVGSWAVSIGPGSFTGLRVGVATVKGLAFARGALVAPVPTLAALAVQGAAAAPGLPVLAVLDARRGEVYAAIHGPGDPLAPALLGPEVLGPAALAERAAVLGGGVAVVGPGVGLVEGALRARLGDALRVVPGITPGAASVASLGVTLLAAGQGVPAAEIAPCYGRRAEAEVRRARAEGRFDTPRDVS